MSKACSLVRRLLSTNLPALLKVAKTVAGRTESSHKVFLLYVVLVASLLGPASSSFSQEAQVWTNLGLYGGQIYDIAVDHTNPDKMFAGSYEGDGLFVTTDAGETWRAVETENEPEGEGTFKNHAVYAVKIAPSDNDVIWVTNAYWLEKSTDGGENWTHILNAEMQRDCANCGGEGDDLRYNRSLAIDLSDQQRAGLHRWWEDLEQAGKRKLQWHSN